MRRFLFVILFGLAQTVSAQVLCTIGSGYRGFDIAITNIPSTTTTVTLYADDGVSRTTATFNYKGINDLTAFAKRNGLDTQNYMIVLILSDGVNINQYQWGPVKPKDVLDLIGGPSFTAAAKVEARALATKWGKQPSPILNAMRRAVVSALNADADIRIANERAAQTVREAMAEKEKINPGQ